MDSKSYNNLQALKVQYKLAQAIFIICEKQIYSKSAEELCVIRTVYSNLFINSNVKS
jgi:hypothetical protein